MDGQTNLSDESPNHVISHHLHQHQRLSGISLHLNTSHHHQYVRLFEQTHLLHHHPNLCVRKSTSHHIETTSKKQLSECYLAMSFVRLKLSLVVHEHTLLDERRASVVNHSHVAFHLSKIRMSGMQMLMMMWVKEMSNSSR